MIEGRKLSRRGFMGLFGAVSVVAATNPTHFLSPVGGWKSNTIINPTIGEYADYINVSDLYNTNYIDIIGSYMASRMTSAINAAVAGKNIAFVTYDLE